MKNELKRLWEEADVTKFKAMWQNLPEETVENHGKLQQGKPMPISQLRFNQHPFLIQARTVTASVNLLGYISLRQQQLLCEDRFCTTTPCK